MSQFAYAKFLKLIQVNENEALDFKVMTTAFEEKGATAELVKDIIAMANNGYKSSLLVFGVSDNKQGFRSMENKKLNELNIQTLCRDWIFPVPFVKVFDEVWNHQRVDSKHKGKRFVIVQIGPNPRQCFRFNREYINWKEEKHFRKNEVWVRRGSSSDTAHPEEIKQLLEGKDYKEKEVFEGDVNYLELPKSELLDTIRKDLANLVSQKGGMLENLPYRREDMAKIAMLRLPISNEELHLFVLFVKEEWKDYANKIFFETVENDALPNHQGYLIVSTAHSKKSFINLIEPEMHLKKSWGNLLVPGGMAYLSYVMRLGWLKEEKGVGPFILDLPKVTTRASFTRQFLELYEFLSDPKEIQRVHESSKELRRLIDFE